MSGTKLSFVLWADLTIKFNTYGLEDSQDSDTESEREEEIVAPEFVLPYLLLHLLLHLI